MNVTVRPEGQRAAVVLCRVADRIRRRPTRVRAPLLNLHGMAVGADDPRAVHDVGDRQPAVREGHRTQRVDVICCDAVAVLDDGRGGHDRRFVVAHRDPIPVLVRHVWALPHGLKARTTDARAGGDHFHVSDRGVKQGARRRPDNAREALLPVGPEVALKRSGLRGRARELIPPNRRALYVSGQEGKAVGGLVFARHVNASSQRPRDGLRNGPLLPAGP